MQLFFHTLSFFSSYRFPKRRLHTLIKEFIIAHNRQIYTCLFGIFFASARLENDAMAWIAHFSLSWQNLLRCWNSRSCWTDRMAPLPNKDWPQRCAFAAGIWHLFQLWPIRPPLQTSFYVPLQPWLIETPATSYSYRAPICCGQEPATSYKMKTNIEWRLPRLPAKFYHINLFNHMRANFSMSHNPFLVQNLTRIRWRTITTTNSERKGPAAPA